MTTTLDELRERAEEEFGIEIVTQNHPCGDDANDPGPFWLLGSGGYLVCPGLSSLQEIAEMLDMLGEEADEAERPKPPPPMTEEDRAEIARRIADQPTITGSGEKQQKTLAGQQDLFRR